VARKKRYRPEKICCEVCSENNPKALHYHHIIERCKVESTENWDNISILCATCHNLVHANVIKILGLFPATKKPYNRILVFRKNGVCNAQELIGETYGK